MKHLKEMGELYINKFLLQQGKYKMGGKFILYITNSGKVVETIEVDNRTFYGGRGAKYNTTIKHDLIVEEITMNRFKLFVKKEKKDKREHSERMLERNRLEEEKNQGGFYAETRKDGEFSLYDFKDFSEENFDKAAKFLSEKTGKTITKEHIQNNHEGWLRDFKTYTKIDDEYSLFCPCGCNSFGIYYFKGGCEQSWV